MKNDTNVEQKMGFNNAANCAFVQNPEDASNTSFFCKTLTENIFRTSTIYPI